MVARSMIELEACSPIFGHYGFPSAYYIGNDVFEVVYETQVVYDKVFYSFLYVFTWIC